MDRRTVLAHIKRSTPWHGKLTCNTVCAHCIPSCNFLFFSNTLIPCFAIRPCCATVAISLSITCLNSNCGCPVFVHYLPQQRLWKLDWCGGDGSGDILSRVLIIYTCTCFVCSTLLNNGYLNSFAAKTRQGTGKLTWGVRIMYVFLCLCAYVHLCVCGSNKNHGANDRWCAGILAVNESNGHTGVEARYIVDNDDLLCNLCLYSTTWLFDLQRSRFGTTTRMDTGSESINMAGAGTFQNDHH